MKFSVSRAFMIGLGMSCLPLMASPLTSDVEAFKSALKAEIADKPDKQPTKPVAAAYDDPGVLMANLDQIPSQMGSPNAVRNVEIQVSELLTAYTHKDVQATGRALLDEIHRQDQAHLEAAESAARDLLKRTSTAIAKAKSASDLDAVVTDSQQFLNDKSGYNTENQALYQQVADATDFAKNWQDYLSHLANKQRQLAASDLQNALASNKGSGIIPRSQMLSLLAAAMNGGTGDGAAATGVASAETQEVIKGINRLDDMEPALQKLSALAANDPQAGKAYAELMPLAQLYTSVNSGLPEVLNFNSLGTGAENVLAPRLQSQLLLLVFAHYFDTYKGPAPAADEKPDRFVDKVMADALAREDWPLLKKVAAAKTFFNRSSAIAMSGPNIAVGVDDLLAGINQEAAAQYSLAVVSYQDALKVSDTTIPAKFIGDRLAAIKKDHPAEYEDGMKMVTSPPSGRSVPATAPAVKPPQ